MEPDVPSNLKDPENKKDCEMKKPKIDITNIFNTENVYDMKKVKKDVGIPLYPKLKSGKGPLPTPINPNTDAASAPVNPTADAAKSKFRVQSEIEELDDDY